MCGNSMEQQKENQKELFKLDLQFITYKFYCCVCNKYYKNIQ